MIEHLLCHSTAYNITRNYLLGNYILGNLSDNVATDIRAILKFIISLARTPEIGQGLGRILSCGARKPEQT